MPVAEIDEEERPGTSLMPAGLHKIVKPEQFADLIAYLATLKQPKGESPIGGNAGTRFRRSKTDPARAAAQGRDAVRPSGLDCCRAR